jgi:hypothetical protein
LRFADCTWVYSFPCRHHRVWPIVQWQDRGSGDGLERGDDTRVAVTVVNEGTPPKALPPGVRRLCEKLSEEAALAGNPPEKIKA